MISCLKKRGLSPVVATVLLIAIAIVIALIILLWARSFVGEFIEKSISGKSERIESFCPDVSFSADVHLDNNKITVSISNKGNIPLYSVQLMKIGAGSRVNAGMLNVPSASIKSGETYSGEITAGINFEAGDKVLIIPVLLGEVKEQKKFYVCGEEYGLEEEVKSV